MPIITSSIWTAEGLPEGVVIDKDEGVISGTVANAGDYTIPVKVKTDYGEDTKDVTLLVKARTAEYPLTLQAANKFGIDQKDFTIVIKR